MRTVECNYSEPIGTLANMVCDGYDPVLMFGEGFDGFVAISPEMLENLMFGTLVLESIDRTELYL